MEIIAVLRALELLKEPCTVDLYTDSQYVSKAIRDKWLEGWIARGWITSAKKPVKNRDLWERMAVLLKMHRVSFHWLKGPARTQGKLNDAMNLPELNRQSANFLRIRDFREIKSARLSVYHTVARHQNRLISSSYSSILLFSLCPFPFEQRCGQKGQGTVPSHDNNILSLKV